MSLPFQLNAIAYCAGDRIDNDVGYVRGNLRWATAVQQNTNKRGGLANKRKPSRGESCSGEA